MGVIDDLERKAPADMTHFELAMCRVYYKEERERRGPKGWFEDITWEDIIKREREARMEGDLWMFIGSQRSVAKFVRAVIADRGSTGADQIIAYVAGTGLEENARAALIAMREYETMIANWESIAFGQIIEKLLQFYSGLGKAFRLAGIEL